MKYLILLLLLFSSICGAKPLHGPPVLPEYMVGVKEAPPFAFKEDGKWKGLTIDLVTMLAKEHMFRPVYVETDNVNKLLTLANTNQVKFSGSAISMTDTRELIIDFSHPYFETPQGIITKDNGSSVWFVVKRILLALVCLLIGLYIIGFIIARLDPNDKIDNAHKGAWFGLVTFTTTGYGDYVPVRPVAMLFASTLMIVSMFVSSVFTGYISSAMTVKKLTDEPTSIDQLFKTTVGSIPNTTGGDLLNLFGIQYVNIKNVQEGIQQVQHGNIKAFVQDKAILDYLSKQGDNDLRVWPINNRGLERYALIFPTGSELREPFNVSILNITSSSEWKMKKAEYFGN